ncbi:hypothetical protein KB236_07010 [Levilactobacillus brevis]|nr:hypothetical protein KB236_07010 [Levilactobacillus brevis]
MTAVMGLSIAVPTFTSIGNDVTAHAASGRGFYEITEKQAKVDDKNSWNSMSAAQKKMAVEDAKVDDPNSLKDKSSNEYKYNQVLKKQAAKKKAAKKAAAKKKARAYAYKVSKLTSKKTKSNKYVKVSGTIKVNNKTNAKKHKATWDRITTYKGYKYVRLSKKGTFTKTIKAPEAKSTWAKAGYYAKKVKNGKVVKKNGKIVYTFHLLSDSKKVKVQAYK